MADFNSSGSSGGEINPSELAPLQIVRAGVAAGVQRLTLLQEFTSGSADSQMNSRSYPEAGSNTRALERLTEASPPGDVSCLFQVFDFF